MEINNENIESTKEVDNIKTNETKENKNKILLFSYIFSFVLIVIITGLFYFFNWWKEKFNTPLNTWLEEKIDIQTLDNMWLYDDIINYYENLWTWSLDDEEKLNLAKAYLDKGIYFYAQDEMSQKALSILNSMKEWYEVLYYKWFIEEMIRNYSRAIDYYNKALSLENLSDKQKSILYNQIWHAYDLAWEWDKIFEYYDKAFKLDSENVHAIMNLWRYYWSQNDLNKLYEYFNLALPLISNLPQKSEVYFSLSGMELELNWLKPDIEKSIDYAKKWIEAYSSYPMNYIALAKWYYVKNDKNLYAEMEKNLNKAIELNPKSTYAQEMLALIEFDKQNYDIAFPKMWEVINLISEDPILMWEEKEIILNEIFFYWLMFKTLLDAKGDEETIINFINENWWLTNHIIRTQIKREWYGIFSILKDNKDFNNLINNAIWEK